MISCGKTICESCNIQQAKDADHTHKPEPTNTCPVCGSVQAHELRPIGLCPLCAARVYHEAAEQVEE